MPAPLIGITTYRTKNRYGYPQICVNEAYITSLTNSGAVPTLIPLGLSEENMRSLLDRLDGVLFSGGGDIQPERYGSQPHPLVDNVDPDRDRVELFIFDQVVQRQKPFLGICRGLQLINVALGGTLYEDISDQRPDSLSHQNPDTLPRDTLSHPVSVLEDSLLHQILDQRDPPVNSLHHQGIRRLASPLKPTAYAPDGIIEAFEIPDYPFGLAVQWHPEWLQEHAAMQRLFRSFVQAAGQRTR